MPPAVPDTRKRRARGPVTGAERKKVAEMHAAGESRAAIARKLKRSPTTIGRIGAELDLIWDHAKTAAATRAKQIDNRARRADLITRAYDEAGESLDAMRLGDDGLYLAVGTAANGSTIVTAIPVVPPQDRKALASSFGTLVTNVSRLESLDAGNGADEQKSMLGQLTEALGMAAAKIHTTPPGGEQ